MANPQQKIARVGQAGKGKEKGADLQSDFSMEVEIPESAEISSATNKTAAGILIPPDAPQNQPTISAAPTQSTSAQSRPTTPPNTKHPSPASAGNSPARKQRNMQTGTRFSSRHIYSFDALPEIENIQVRDPTTKRRIWINRCGFCYKEGHGRSTCPGLLVENMEYRIKRFQELSLLDDPHNPMFTYKLEDTPKY